LVALVAQEGIPVMVAMAVDTAALLRVQVVAVVAVVPRKMVVVEVVTLGCLVKVVAEPLEHPEAQVVVVLGAMGQLLDFALLIVFVEEAAVVAIAAKALRVVFVLFGPETPVNFRQLA
jgi:hypothetical protein